MSTRFGDDISIYDGPQIFLEQFRSVPEMPRMLFTAHWCQSEVRNGGLHQFFSNSTGVLAPEAVVAFRTIGMPTLAGVVSTSMEWFGDNYPRDRDVRLAWLIEYEREHPDECDPFEELDVKFYALIDTENGGFETAADAYADENLV